MSIADVLTLRGGVAPRAHLSAGPSRAETERAHAAGELVVLARGRYAAPYVGDARRVAHELSAVLSHRHAAGMTSCTSPMASERPPPSPSSSYRCPL